MSQQNLKDEVEEVEAQEIPHQLQQENQELKRENEELHKKFEEEKKRKNLLQQELGEYKVRAAAQKWREPIRHELEAQENQELKRENEELHKKFEEEKKRNDLLQQELREYELRAAARIRARKRSRPRMQEGPREEPIDLCNEPDSPPAPASTNYYGLTLVPCSCGRGILNDAVTWRRVTRDAWLFLAPF